MGDRAGRGNHGRLRGCPGSAPRGGVDGWDGTALRFLVKKDLERQNEEEEQAKVKRLNEEKEERRMKRINAKVCDDIPLTHEEHEAWKRWIVAYASSSSSSGSKRKRKKGRKRKLPKSSSSRSTCGRARRRQRQWHAPGWFPRFDASHAVFPSSVGMPEFPGILAGMDQKDSGPLIVDSCSDMCKARIAGFTARCVFPLVVGRPAGRSVWTRRTIMQFAGFTGDDAPRAVLLFFVVRPKMFGIMAGMTQKDSCLEEYHKIGFFWEMTSYVSVFSSLVRQWFHIYVSLQRPGLWFRLQKTAEFPQLQFWSSTSCSCCGS